MVDREKTPPRRRGEQRQRAGGSAHRLRVYFIDKTHIYIFLLILGEQIASSSQPRHRQIHRLHQKVCTSTISSMREKDRERGTYRDIVVTNRHHPWWSRVGEWCGTHYRKSPPFPPGRPSLRKNPQKKPCLRTAKERREIQKKNESETSPFIWSMTWRISALAGAFDFRSLTSSTPSINPLPRTSPMTAERESEKTDRKKGREAPLILTIMLFLKLVQFLFEIGADKKGVFLKLLLLDDPENSQPASSANGVASESIEVAPPSQNFCNFRCCDHCTNRQPVPDPLDQRVI